MSDTFRKDYKPLRPEISALIFSIKEAAEILECYMTPIKSREMSLALTNLEQSIMWATKAICLDAEAKDDR